MTPMDYIRAARVPETLEPQCFGLWEIRRVTVTPDIDKAMMAGVGFPSMTMLHRSTLATMMRPHGEVVMEDSIRELRRHLPIWLRARGHVLVTGLGLGCVVRGLLASDQVERITVVEIDKGILKIVGREFERNPRVRLIEGNALKIDLAEKFDYAWHDIWTEGETHLQVLHTRLIVRFGHRIPFQGARMLPRQVKRAAQRAARIGVFG